MNLKTLFVCETLSTLSAGETFIVSSFSVNKYFQSVSKFFSPVWTLCFFSSIRPEIYIYIFYNPTAQNTLDLPKITLYGDKNVL